MTFVAASCFLSCVAEEGALLRRWRSCTSDLFKSVQPITRRIPGSKERVFEFAGQALSAFVMTLGTQSSIQGRKTDPIQICVLLSTLSSPKDALSMLRECQRQQGEACDILVESILVSTQFPSWYDFNGQETASELQVRAPGIQRTSKTLTLPLQIRKSVAASCKNGSFHCRPIRQVSLTSPIARTYFPWC